MVKKIIAILMSFIFVLFPLSVAADNSNTTKTQNVSIASYNNSDSYLTYKEKYSEYRNSEKAIEETFGTKLENAGQTIDWNINIPENAFYQPEIVYTALPGSNSDIEMRLLIDGASVYSQADNFSLCRIWKNSTEEYGKDKKGDEYSPEQQEVFESQ